MNSCAISFCESFPSISILFFEGNGAEHKNWSPPEWSLEVFAGEMCWSNRPTEAIALLHCVARMKQYCRHKSVNITFWQVFVTIDIGGLQSEILCCDV
jgi:hypothetical protein